MYWTIGVDVVRSLWVKRTFQEIQSRWVERDRRREPETQSGRMRGVGVLIVHRAPRTGVATSVLSKNIPISEIDHQHGVETDGGSYHSTSIADNQH